jgi:multidrug efflux pump
VTLSELAIRRPVLATVMNLLVIVAGISAWLGLPVRELPDVDNPLVSVRTVYLGASPETVEATITEPLEQVLNGIEAIRSIESTSAFSSSSITLEFEAGRDVDVAATDVQNAVQRALGRLPAAAQRPVVRKTGANSGAIIFLNVFGENYSAVDLTDIADRLVKTPLQLLPGVAQVIIAGERRYAMRVWLDPARMAARGVDALDVKRALEQSNLQLPAGVLEADARKYVINADAQLVQPEQFAAIVIREDGRGVPATTGAGRPADGGRVPVRIRDVGWVELGSADYQSVTRYSGRPVVGIGIVRQSRSNELEVSKGVRDAIATIQPTLPPGVDLTLGVDFTVFVKESIDEVYFTLWIALMAVVGVNLFFLQSKTTTAIASVSIPVAVIGTFAAVAALGFTLNVLTLLALVLSIGLVVDDAIVVMENVYRRQELGEARGVAARNGSREVGFPVMATTAALVAVLIPLSLMSGDTGRLFREFAISLAVAVVISMFVALSLVPMLCSRFLQVKPRGGVVSRSIEAGIRRLRSAYDRVLAAALVRPWLVAGLFGAFLLGSVGLYRAIPSTFLPIEDRGRFVTVIRTPEGATSAYTLRALEQVEKLYLAEPEIEGFFAAIGMNFGAPGSSSRGMVFTRLRHWDDRDVKQQAIVSKLVPALQQIPEALVFAINPPGLSRRRQADVEVVLRSPSASLDELAAASDGVVTKLRGLPGLQNADSDLRITNPQLDIAFDRERAADVGVSISALAESLRLLVAQGPADEFILRNEQYDVVMALEAPYRSVPDQLGEIHVRTTSGAMVPLSALLETRPRSAPSSLNHYNLQRAATVTGNLAPGATLGDMLDRVEAAVREDLPAGFAMALGGTSREFRESSTQIYLTFALALLVIYLVLSAQFESFLHPFTVLLAVPLAALGALTALWLTGQTINLYSQIGMILLIGLVTKNAILLVDFANQERARGTEIFEALRRAGHTRFRPIVMTSATSILGAMPLALAAGAGAESRQAIGVAVVGGLLFSTVFTLVMIPVLHLAMIRFAERIGWNTIPPAVALELEERE